MGHTGTGLPEVPNFKQQGINIVVSRELFENLVDDAICLKAEWTWKQAEPRCGYAEEYAELKQRITDAVKIRDSYK